ncbi:protein translocase subunit SecF [Paenirhodobacter enshiensis]|uniref:protein translocase subunit SecF n=1 Tax=Paenirhodobacter enshiensis TaxID=1105367 RepID=UPI0035AF3580
MAFRLKLAPVHTNFDFFRHQILTLGGASLLTVLSIFAMFWPGLNFGIDFRGGTTIRTETSQPLDIGKYRSALETLHLGDVVISEVFDPAFGPDQHVATVRIQAQGDSNAAMDGAAIARVTEALRTVDPDVKVISTESVGPKVSGELIWTAAWSILATLVGIMLYIWLRFEWQFGVGTGVALIHDLFLTIGLFVVFQLKVDLTIVAALLTLLGYSVNDKVVVFDRLRENLVKYKSMPLREVMNLSVNETLSRTVVTSVTTLLALIPLLVLGGDVIRGFVFAMVWGVLIGTYSSIFVAKNIVLFLGVNRNRDRKIDPAAKLFGDKVEVADADK